MTNKPLKRTARPLYHIINGKRVEGPNDHMMGDYSELEGDCSGLWGDCSGLEGNLDDIPLSERPAGLGNYVDGNEKP